MLRTLTPDGSFLFITRIARMFGYGFLSLVLVLYLEQVGLNQVQIGLLLTLTLIGDTIISLWITTNADRFGRRRMLILGAVLMIFAGTPARRTAGGVFSPCRITEPAATIELAPTSAFSRTVEFIPIITLSWTHDPWITALCPTVT